MDPQRPKTLSTAEQGALRLTPGTPQGATAALNDWVAATIAGTKLSIPWFDPLDAGTDARVLFLLESPGPKADAGAGSGLISADNNDPTAHNMWMFRKRAGLDASVGVHWNIVPWYLDGGKPQATHLERGARLLIELLGLLPRLEVVVAMGRDAQRGWLLCQQKLGRRHIVTVPTWHPGNLALNSDPTRRIEVQRAMFGVSAYLDADEPTPREPLQPRPSDIFQAVPRRARKLASGLRKRGDRWSEPAQGGSGG